MLWIYLLLKKGEQNQGLWQKRKIQPNQVSCRWPFSNTVLSCLAAQRVYGDSTWIIISVIGLYFALDSIK